MYFKKVSGRLLCIAIIHLVSVSQSWPLSKLLLSQPKPRNTSYNSKKLKHEAADLCTPSIYVVYDANKDSRIVIPGLVYLELRQLDTMSPE